MTKEANRLQFASEVDSFTEERYLQMIGCADQKNDILDVGCNTGRGGAILKQMLPHAQIDGVEIIRERIEKIPQGIYRKIFCEYIENLDLEDHSYDAILAGEFIEHIHKPVLQALLKKFHKILKPGGRIIFTTPNPHSLLVLMGRNGVLKEISHVNIVSVKQLKNLIEEADFRIIDVKGCGKMTRVLGQNFPFMSVYGSYLISATPINNE